jgi:hypothetical protein
MSSSCPLCGMEADILKSLHIALISGAGTNEEREIGSSSPKPKQRPIRRWRETVRLQSNVTYFVILALLVSCLDSVNTGARN